MTICILKPCEVRHNATLLQLKGGEFLALPDKPEGKLITAGVARQATSDDYSAMMDDFGKRSPVCGWEVIKQRSPETWSTHIKAVRSGDIGTAVRTFNEMLHNLPATTSNTPKGEKTNDQRQV